MTEHPEPAGQADDAPTPRAPEDAAPHPDADARPDTPDAPIPVPAATPLAPAPSPARPKEKDLFGREPDGYDDWSHRRGEPRVFALIWMLFLMCVTGLMFASISDAFYVSPTITRPAARGMILTTMAGLVLLWPAIRLSQQPAERPARSVLRDLFVLLVPAQAVIWPNALPELADWPVDLLLALAGSFVAWSLLVGGLLALADAGRHAGHHRGLWMLAVLLVALGAPLVAILTGSAGPALPDTPRPGWMLSPLTSVLEITRDRLVVGRTDPVADAQWRILFAAACAGGAFMLLAAAAGPGAARRGESDRTRA